MFWESCSRGVAGAIILGALGLGLPGCGRGPGSADRGGAASSDASTDAHAHHHHHDHQPPHGGTAVALGDEVYHLELVRDAESGAMDAYVLDGHLENFIRIDSASFDLAVTLSIDGESDDEVEDRVLTFFPVASRATGETVGDTSAFRAEAEWLKTTEAFEAVLVLLEIRGSRFENVVFSFPEGNH